MIKFMLKVTTHLMSKLKDEYSQAKTLHTPIFFSL